MAGAEEAAPRRLWRLDALRGFAACYVAAGHWTELWPHGGAWAYATVPFRFGQEAVILFFLLSGFVIKYSFDQFPDQGFFRYLVHRFVRIYLPFLAVLLLCLVTGSFLRGLDPRSAGTFFGNLLMLQDDAHGKPGVIVGPWMGYTPLWSLSYEWWFYLLFFPFTRLATRFRQNLLALGLVIATGGLYLRFPNFGFRVLAYFAIWWLGVLLANAYEHRDGYRWIAGYCLWLAVFSFAELELNLVGIFATGHPGGVLARALGRDFLGIHPILEARHCLAAVLLVSLGLLWQRLRWLGFGWLVGPFAAVVPFSYFLYISHFFLLRFLEMTIGLKSVTLSAHGRSR